MTARSALRRAVAALTLTALGTLLVWAPVAPAAAHDELLFSDPSDTGVLATVPSRAVLTFSGPVAEVHEVTVTGPDGSVTNGAPSSTGAEVRQNLWGGPDGAYTLTYDVLSSDGHEIAGEIRFAVGEDGAGDDAGAARASSSTEAGSDGALRGVVVPAGVVLLSAACALVIWHRRRSA